MHRMFDLLKFIGKLRQFTVTKLQSMEWHHSNSPTKNRKEKPNLNTRKLMATVFWDRKGLIHVEFMPRGETINSEAYIETLHRLRRAIQNKRRGMLSSKVVLIHDNARPHCSARTKAELNSFKWQIFGHPPYSPDLAPSDYHLFPKLKVFLGGKNFLGDEDLKEGVKTWLHSLAAEQYNVGIEKLVPRYNKCLDSSGDFVEK
uniref:Tc1-like transposase DDE domain-containing protein n=1 Tax=Homalodisca liturata TaxID=320908 RepID=A0A1B6JMV6_9HEMI